MAKTSSAVKNRYNSKAYDQIGLRVPKGEKEKIQEHATAKGMSLNAYIKQLIDEDMHKAVD